MTGIKQLQWSQWFALVNIDLHSIPSASGVYQIRWAIGKKPQPIERTNGTDDSGCLYIGKTVNLRRRISRLCRGIIHGTQTHTVSYDHTAAYTYTFYGFEKKIKPDQLEVRWGELPRNVIGEWEQELLEDYGAKYLDKPPLNISVRRR